MTPYEVKISLASLRNLLLCHCRAPDFVNVLTDADVSSPEAAQSILKLIDLLRSLILSACPT
jgi:hypothetical protein